MHGRYPTDAQSTKNQTKYCIEQFFQGWLEMKAGFHGEAEEVLLCSAKLLTYNCKCSCGAYCKITTNRKEITQKWIEYLTSQLFCSYTVEIWSPSLGSETHSFRSLKNKCQLLMIYHCRILIVRTVLPRFAAAKSWPELELMVKRRSDGMENWRPATGPLALDPLPAETYPSAIPEVTKFVVRSQLLTVNTVGPLITGAAGMDEPQPVTVTVTVEVPRLCRKGKLWCCSWKNEHGSYSPWLSVAVTVKVTGLVKVISADVRISPVDGFIEKLCQKNDNYVSKNIVGT